MIVKTLHIVRERFQYTGADFDRPDGYIMTTAAVTVQLCAEVLFQGLRFVIHFHCVSSKKCKAAEAALQK